ncbi:MAG: TPM domain-containing protein [Betaproteobacteria bacterium]|nr:TPM domain-containing protein [Betaproteobacteria bacterium]
MLAAALRLLALVALLAAGPAPAVDVPFLTGRVVDNAEILKPATRAKLTADLKALEERTTHQVAVLTVTTLAGESVEDFATRVFESWKLGVKGKDNGVLVVVVPQDRRMRIEVGYGLEGTLTDAQAARIIRDRMTPAFKAGDYDRGVADGVAAIAAVLGGEKLPEAASSGTSSGFASSLDSIEQDLPPWPMRILLGAFIFGVIGLFTVVGVLTPGMGWFLYVFLIPFWAMFPIIIVGVKGALVLLATYIVVFPIAKLIVSRKPEYRKAAEELKRTGRTTYNGVVITSGGMSSGGGSSSRSSGGGFSGGGGSSGGGGASGSW